MNRILVVEDDTFIRDLTTQKLENAGFVVDAVDSVKSARHKLVSNTVDLILLDLELPDTSGLVYLEELKNDAAKQKVPVIIFSNLDDPETEKNALKLGAAAYFIKIKTDYNELIEKINGALV